MSAFLDGKEIKLGVCYYPEHWDRSLWRSDLERMKETGLNTMRIAEFSWNKFEPEDGIFDYSFFDDFLDLVEEIDMKVIFCTPTATPPAWLTQHYPEVLNSDIDGNLFYHGGRRHYNYNSPVYRKFTARIVENIAAHYCRRSCIVGWQIDNELNCEMNEFHSESDSISFRNYVHDKYGTLDALNAAWGTTFWNQTYTSWDEIYVPRRTTGRSINPHLMLDYYRFISASTNSFLKLQSDILEKYIKADDFITTNGIFSNIDYQVMKRDSLDFITYDSYPNFAYCIDGHNKNDLMKDRNWSRDLSEVRAISPIFGIMEQQSGANGWNIAMEAPTPKPGQISLWAMQSIAHGADYVSFFRWRTCTFGTEMYWHGILDYSGRDNRRIREIKNFSKTVNKLSVVAGAQYKASVAVIKDYDNVWDAQLDMWHRRVEDSSRNAIFTALQLAHIPFDYVYINDDTPVERLEYYDFIFAPHLSIMTAARALLLERYTAAGGRIIFGARTGYKDITGKCVSDYLPGMLSRLCGTDIPEYSFVSPEDAPLYADWDGVKLEAAVFNDLLEPASDTAEVLAYYKGTYYDGVPALICNHFGQGNAYYFGGAFTKETVDVIIKKCCLTSPLADIADVPAECEIALRSNGNTQYLFILNYTCEDQFIELHQMVFNLIDGHNETGRLELKGYGYKVYRL